MHSENGAIGFDCFPTPHLALSSADDGELTRVRRFADMQVVAAGRVHEVLSEEWQEFRGRPRRVRALLAAYHELVQWRYRLARVSPVRHGTAVPVDPERFLAPIDHYGPNCDRIGRVGRLRFNSTWNEVDRVFTGGVSTPAFRVTLRYGRAAEARFLRSGAAGDILTSSVRLPDGTRIDGNRLVRGAAARELARELAARVAGRGCDTRRFETGGAPIYVVTAENTARAEMFRQAIDLLAGAGADDVASWQQARFLLYQAPRTKRGSDSVIRTFLVAVGAVLFGAAPRLVHDVDLQCLVLGQGRATAMSGDPGSESAPQASLES
ncbi:hypothetical protein [Nocardia jiangsuensis]|uniref:Uncharacterized protein n=1 Tax=Nocardia jiangsuensis TaxID=1691563 RepID=A0ABV8E2F8_9NOCA